MMVAPGFTISGVMNPGLPMAATRMSAWRVIAPRSRVFEWQIVTVAFSCSSSMATGLPTMSLRPTTTACCPLMGRLLRLRISMTPAGVQGARAGGRPAACRHSPDESRRRPLSGETESSRNLASTCFGKRKLDQDAVDVLAIVEAADQIQHFFGCHGVRRGDQVAVEAEFAAGFYFAGDVDLRCWHVTDEHRGQSRTNTLGRERFSPLPLLHS